LGESSFDIGTLGTAGNRDETLPVHVKFDVGNPFPRLRVEGPTPDNLDSRDRSALWAFKLMDQSRCGLNDWPARGGWTS
jgi:hypothetical protein